MPVKLILIATLLCLPLLALSQKTTVDGDSLIDGAKESSQQQQSDQHTVQYSTLDLDASRHPFFFYEHFDDEITFNQRWTRSQATKSDSQEFQFDGEWTINPSHSKVKGDSCLVMSSKAKHHAIASKLPKAVSTKDGLLLQYEVQFRNGQECGGAYLKLLSAPSGQLNQLNDKTQYSIMFGPDKCGNDYKLHFIFNHKNPKNGTLREIHWRKATTVAKMEDVVKDGRWHLLRLHIKADDTYEIQLDKKTVGKGSLFDDFGPPVNPPREIDDPYDTKPEDWDERENIPDPDDRKPDDWDESQPRKIPDPAATKPADWNENEAEIIPDPEATKPADWDPDMDGEWQAPLVPNPKCKSISGCGPWKAPLIDNPQYRGKWKPRVVPNPNYQGKWAPRKIPNPDFFEDKQPHLMLPFDAVAFELWTISDGIAFDNILISNQVPVADHVIEHTFQIKKDLADEESDSWFVKLIRATNKRPWLWAVYVLVIAIPVILFIAYCCIEPVKRREDDELITRKKTDAVSPDDEPDNGPVPRERAPSNRVQIRELNDEEAEEVEGAVGGSEAESGQEEEEEVADGQTEEEEVEEDEVEEPAVEEEEPEEEPIATKSSTRQRKGRSRKE